MAFISFQPSDHYNTKLYTGTSAEHSVTGVGFQPDFTWIKRRNGTYNHNLYDAVRGTTKEINSNLTDAESTVAQGLTAFGADGFTLGTDDQSNATGDTFASWNWKAGTTSGIAGSPSITPDSYSFNATSGFSIIKYTGNGVSGATLPHGLGVAPDCIIVKGTSASETWATYFNIWLMKNEKYMVLNTTAAVADHSEYWNDTSPTSTLFSLGNGGAVNNNTANYIAYCFANKKGFFHTGEYRGNGSSTQPPCIFTGFRPGFVMFKAINYVAAWLMFDNKRQVFNGGPGGNLAANDVAAEATGTGGTKGVDYYSNGFRVPYTTDNALNGDGYGYMYMAFGASPFVSSNDIPGTAN